MLLRNLKCDHCGSLKINELSTGYIYCDYCSALMGFDMKNIHEEVKEVFSSDEQNEIQNKFNEAAQRMAQALNDHNSDDFIKIQLELKQLEFLLFPKRFSPKVKQSSYRKRYLNYFEAYWVEKIEEDYFNKAKRFQAEINPLAKNLTTKIVDNKVITEYNKDFEAYLKVLDKYIRTSIKETLNMKSIELYPEPYAPSFDILYKQSIDSTLQMFDNETVTKTIEFLGLQSDYIKVEDVQIDEKNCFVCNSTLNAPANSKSMVCEKCGNINDFISEKIQCLGCGASILYKETDTCEYCGARHFNFDQDQEENLTDNDEAMSLGGLFKKIFS